MKTNRLPLGAFLVAVVLTLASETCFSDSKDYFAETGTLTAMQAVPCGSLARGFTGIGGLLATAGVERVTSKDKLCQEYELRTSYIEYRIRPVSEKDATLLPVGEKSHFRIVKDRILLSVPEGDGKVREYKVVAMKPLTSDDESSTGAASANAQALLGLQRRPATTASNPSPAGTSSAGVADPPSSAQTAAAAHTESSVNAGAASGATAPAPARLTAAVLPASSSGPGSPQPSSPQGGSPPASLPASLPPASEPGVAFNSPPLTRAQVMGLVAGGVASARVASFVRQRGISFQPSPEFLTDLKSVGATDELLQAISTAGNAPPARAAQPTDSQPPAQAGNPARLQGLAESEQQDRTAELARPGDASAHFALAETLGEEGKWSEASAQYAAVISSEPDDAAAHNDLALALRKSGDLDGAIREYHRALAIDPSRAAVHDNLGVALSQKGDVNGAAAEFHEAVRQDPADSEAHNNLGSMLEQQHDLEGAIREYRQALALGGRGDVQYNLGTALELKGDLDGAIAGFRQALAANPNSARMHSALAGALERKGDVAGALNQYTIALKLAPEDPAIRAGYDRLTKSGG
jgi:Flp pilus assembly protein TadD